MSFGTILFQEREEVAVVTLNRPERLNALSLVLLEELRTVIGEIGSREDLKSILITGGDKVFCAGADINIFSGLKTQDEAYGFVQGVKQVLGSLKRVIKPVIAAICGHALGGGLELALFCDIRVAAEDAKLGVPEINLGAFPAAGGTQMLPRLIGLARAKEMLFSGKPISGEEAYRIGLVNRVVPKEKVFNESLDTWPGSWQLRPPMLLASSSAWWTMGSKWTWIAPLPMSRPISWGSWPPATSRRVPRRFSRKESQTSRGINSCEERESSFATPVSWIFR
jgi:enoyl-CoA hydratase/carnithine racemase